MIDGLPFGDDAHGDGFIYVSGIFWVNYSDLTVESCLVRGIIMNYHQMAFFQVSDLFSTPGDHVGITDAEVAAGLSTGPETDPGGGLKRSGRNCSPKKNGREKLKIGSLTIYRGYIIYIYIIIYIIIYICKMLLNERTSFTSSKLVSFTPKRTAEPIRHGKTDPQVF